MSASQEEAEFIDHQLKFTFNMFHVLTLLLVGCQNENYAAADDRHRPTLSMDPPTGVVLRGEAVSFTCSSQNGGLRYELYKEQDRITYRDDTKNSYSVKIVIEKAEISDTAKYHCIYRTSIHRGWRDSARSDPVQLTVVERPSKPTLSVDPPMGTVVRGEGTSFICSSRSQGLRHKLYKEQQLKEDRDTPNYSYSATFSIGNARSEATAIYHCICAKLIKGTWIYSEKSNLVQLTIVDQLPKPKISMDHNTSVVTLGESVTINCSGLTRYNNDSYYLYHEYGANHIEQRRVSASELSVTFTITTLSTSDTGKYTCCYKTTINRKEQMSPSSDPVLITVEDSANSSALPVGLACAAIIILVLLLGLAGICLCKRSKVVEPAVPLDPVPVQSTDQPATSNNDEPIIYADLNTAGLTQATSATSPESCVYAGVRGE